MKKLLVVLGVLAAVVVGFWQEAWAGFEGPKTNGVTVKSINHAIRGVVVLEEGGKYKCSARFGKEVEHRPSLLRGAKPWFEVTALLPCDLPKGGRLIVQVNGHLTGFLIPAGVILKGREVYVGIRNIPYVSIDFERKVDGSWIIADFAPQSRRRSCTISVLGFPWENERSLEEWVAHQYEYIKKYVAENIRAKETFRGLILI